jgi:signal transduction histidine kinase
MDRNEEINTGAAADATDEKTEYDAIADNNEEIKGAKACSDKENSGEKTETKKPPKILSAQQGFKYSLMAKFISVVALTVLFVFAAVISYALLLYYDNMYSSDNYCDTPQCLNISYNYAYMAASAYNFELTENNKAEWAHFDAAKTNFSFEIYAADNPGAVLKSNFKPETAAGFHEFTFNMSAGSFLVKTAVRYPLTAKDNYYTSFSYWVYNALSEHVFVFAVALAISLIILAGLLIFLFSAAGKRRTRPGIVLSLIDKIPFDLLLCIALVVFLYITEIIYRSGIIDNIFFTALLVGQLTLLFLIALVTCVSFAVRVKHGKWWKNTLIYYILRFCGFMLRLGVRGARAIMLNLPIFLISALIYGAAALLGTLFLSAWLFELYALYLVFWLAVICYMAFILGKFKKATQDLAAGNLNCKVNTAFMPLHFKKYGETLNKIGDSISLVVEQRLKSEKLKTELITNISHDIKTPLTSIINYADLLQKENLSAQASKYAEVLNRHARRLKKLTEDLLEASKASTGNINVDLQKTGVRELLNQSLGEYKERLSLNRLETVVEEGAEIYIMADGRLLWRVMDNLLSNICKYAQTDTRVYLDIKRVEDEVIITFKNISRERLNIDAEELLERFARGDISRSGEGSGLGLSIAEDLIKNQGGKFSLIVDGDLFKAEICFKAINPFSALKTM